MQHRHHVPELLAPAGGRQALAAAVASGADAVYLGVDRLNARRSAENFTLDTLSEACRFAHLRGVRVYLTVNVIVLPDEVSDALELVAQAWAAGVDAVIVQDIGLIRLIATTMPEVRIHASTQLNAHSTSTVLALAEMGVARVTLAREVSIDEMGRMAAAASEAGIELESFVHGALCVCHSGQCLMSSVIGGRSANRGMCAQPCRLAYELVDEAGSAARTPGAHLLSPKDLCGIGVLPGLVSTGVSSLKIEGRMKSPEYVALVTGTYRAALDRALADPDSFQVREGEMSVLSEAFSRGFTEAYLIGERGNAMMSYTRPNNRGVPVGRIVSVEGATAVIALDTALQREDTIEVWTGRGRFAQRAEGLALEGSPVESAPAGSRVTIALSEAAAAGDRVFRVRNAALCEAAARALDEDAARLPVDIAVELELDRPVSVRLTDARGHEGSAEGSLVERARTKPVSVPEVIEHVGRLGGTPFRAEGFDVALSPGVGIGFSELHRVRRAAVEALAESILAPWAGRVEPRVSVPGPSRPAEHAGAVALVASVRDAECARAALSAGADRVHVAEPFPGAVSDGLVAELPRICHDREEAAALRRARETGAAVVATLGQLRSLTGEEVRLESHWSLNASNPHSVSALAGLGVDLAWLSPELSASQIAEVATSASCPVGIAVFGRQEVMVTEHCVLMALGACDRSCATCERRRGGWSLRDRKGFEFPVRVDAAGRTHVYNAVPLDLTHAIEQVIATGVAAVRVDAATESAAGVEAAVRAVRAALDRPRATRAGKKGRRSTGPGATSGHFFRGVT